MKSRKVQIILMIDPDIHWPRPPQDFPEGHVRIVFRNGMSSTPTDVLVLLRTSRPPTDVLVQLFLPDQDDYMVNWTIIEK